MYAHVLHVHVLASTFSCVIYCWSSVLVITTHLVMECDNYVLWYDFIVSVLHGIQRQRVSAGVSWLTSFRWRVSLDMTLLDAILFHPLPCITFKYSIIFHLFLLPKSWYAFRLSMNTPHARSQPTKLVPRQTSDVNRCRFEIATRSLTLYRRSHGSYVISGRP